MLETEWLEKVIHSNLKKPTGMILLMKMDDRIEKIDE